MTNIGHAFVGPKMSRNNDEDVIASCEAGRDDQQGMHA